MTSAGDSPGPDQVDPAFEGLFRPDDLTPGPGAPPAAPQEPAPQRPTPEPSVQGIAATPEDPSAATKAPAAVPDRQPSADTGRLFRSQGVSDRPDAVLALESGRFSRLRTLERTETGTAPDPSDAAVAALLVETTSEPAAGGDMPSGEPSRRAAREPRRRRSGSSAEPRGSGRGANGIVVALVVIIVTTAVGFANALLGDGSLGWPTGLALLLSSIYAAIAVRRDSDTVAFLIPPVAFLIATLTAGQLFLDSGEGSLVNRGAIAFFTLAENWIWILGSTLLALVIVLVRRRRA